MLVLCLHRKCALELHVFKEVHAHEISCTQRTQTWKRNCFHVTSLTRCLQNKVYTDIAPWLLHSIVIYRQANQIMGYLSFHKWQVSVCNVHDDIWMVQTKTSHLGKVSDTIILLGWVTIWLFWSNPRLKFSCSNSVIEPTQIWVCMSYCKSY